MGYFLNEPIYEFINNEKTLVRLLEPLIYIDDNGEQYEVPRFFKSDGLSVPKLFHWYQSPFDEKALPAGLIHDFILDSPKYNMPFTSANNIFRRCLKARDVRFTKRKILEWSTDLNGLLLHGNKNPNTWDKHQK